jgi:hypothetical protein
MPSVSALSSLCQVNHSLLGPLGLGLAATVLAAARIVSWLAVGAWCALEDGDAAALPLAIVIGAAMTGTTYAVCAALGHIGLGLAFDGALAVVAVIGNRRRVSRFLREVAREAVALAGERPLARAACALWLAFAWLTATAPPRDADVLRYHLAHVRQIALEGQWTKIIDTAYAIPFGWSLTYLPFELLDVSIAAHMLNLALWVIIVLAVHQSLRGRDSAGLRWLLLALSCQPMIFKAATTAHADAYTMLVMTAVALLIGRSPPSLRSAALLGFAAWIGAQSRYQAIGIGIAASLTLILLGMRGRVQPRAVLAAGAGAVVAAVLAAPFYIANLVWFGNPVWPLLVRPGGSSAADRVALVLAQRASEPFALGWLPLGVYRLAIDVTVFPIPWLVAAAVIAGWCTPSTRRVAVFVTCYLATWALVEPALFPRFIVFLVPVIPLLAAGALAQVSADRPRIRVLSTVGLATFANASAALTFLLNAQAIRYAVTGDRVTYDRATWFASVYRWVNTSTPASARFLVVVKAGATYALERPYRRADPEGSAEVDWSALADAQALIDQMRRRGFQYMIYEDRDWHRYPGGDNMARLVREGLAQGLLTAVTTFPVQLVTSRLLGRAVPTTVLLMRVTDAGSAPTTGIGEGRHGVAARYI